jgi:hypothetical protein
MSNQEKFMKKMFTFDGWWDQVSGQSFQKLTQLGFIEEESNEWNNQEENRAHASLIYRTKKGAVLNFPSTGTDAVWANVPGGTRIEEADGPGVSEKDIGVCNDCQFNGQWEFIHNEGRDPELCCLIGCPRCVKANGWSWGKVKLGPTHPYQEEIDIPCNGANMESIHETGDPESEGYSLELIPCILSEIWDYHTDHEPPKWSQFFEWSPPWVHDMLCEVLGFTEGPEIAKDYFMEPGQPMIISDICHPQDDTDDETPMGESDDESEEGLDMVVNIIRNLETTDGPLEEEEEDEEEEEEESVNKVKSAEGLKIIEEIMGGEGQVMDEGKFLELCNIFRDLHQQ